MCTQHFLSPRERERETPNETKRVPLCQFMYTRVLLIAHFLTTPKAHEWVRTYGREEVSWPFRGRLPGPWRWPPEAISWSRRRKPTIARVRDLINEDPLPADEGTWGRSVIIIVGCHSPPHNPRTPFPTGYRERCEHTLIKRVPNPYLANYTLSSVHWRDGAGSLAREDMARARSWHQRLTSLCFTFGLLFQLLQDS